MQDLNTDLTRPVAVASQAQDWLASPSAGVWRRPLYRTGGESGRATTIVRYEPGSSFPGHRHPQGEEIMVLRGVFSDESGDYPAGSYLLNPPGSQHAPRSDDGCDLFVKLRQYGGAGRTRVCVQTRDRPWQQDGTDGVWIQPLYRQAGFPERVELVRLGPGVDAGRGVFPGGVEVLVLYGSLETGGVAYGAGTWLRLPGGARVRLGSDMGCELYLCTGALAPAGPAPGPWRLERRPAANRG